MTGQHRLSVTIVGGGASGVLVAAHLLADPARDLRVTLIEKTDRIGQGLAYSARQRDHRVNVPARGMSAFADQPQHFLDWLKKQQSNVPADGWIFVQRATYGQYLAHVLEQAGRSREGRLTVLNETVTGITETKAGVDVVLGNGSSVLSDFAVLAVGHETQPARSRGIAVRLGSEDDTPLDPDATVMVLGSGLSMVDTWLSLAHANHTGPILVLSRNGLLPRSHRDVAPIEIDAADVPFGTNLNYLVKWFRSLVADTERQGGDWRSVVDGLRPYNQRLWQSWTEHTRRQFLRHLRPWWNIHRHRLPPDLFNRLDDAVRSGQVNLIAGEFLDVARSGDQVVATIRPRGETRTREIVVDRVYDCGGVSVDVLASSNPVVVELVRRGRARPDALNIGLDVSDSCAMIGDDGKPSERVRVVGPLTRGQFFEIEAIPDIRRQASDIAAQILAGKV
jgi:uncharacterized NAD(P)/FAD-binding protein YdhS